MNITRISLIALLSLGAASCTETNKSDNMTGNKDTAVLKSDEQPTATAAAADEWSRVDWNSPVLSYAEVTDRNVAVRGSDQYGIYGLGENILFETGKADIKPSADANLQQVAASISQHYNGKIKIYGYTDDAGADAANKGLSRRRAEAVMAWLTSKGKISADRISLYAEGEARPVASNETPDGRQQNRRVEVVAMK